MAVGGFIGVFSQQDQPETRRQAQVDETVLMKNVSGRNEHACVQRRSSSAARCEKTFGTPERSYHTCPPAQHSPYFVDRQGLHCWL